MTSPLTLVVLLAMSAAPALAQHTHTPDRAQQAMGFDQARTTHHFRIERAGGAIEVTAKDPADHASIDQVRTHLEHITSMFTNGDFSVPMLVHDKNPPGADMMKQRRDTMTFTFETMTSGGKIVIRTTDAKGLDALHEFLRFQIREHHTGDPLKEP
jgi:hypothetical protein